MPFDDDDLGRIAREANNTSYGQAASIWTRDIGIAHKLARRIKAGTVWINTHNFGDPALPFGGYRQSGWGREMGHEAMELYRNQGRGGIPVMPRRLSIDVAEIVRAEISEGGENVRLTLAEAGGGTVVLSLPLSCLGDIAASLPRPLAADTVDRVHSWRLEGAGGSELKLTLQTPEGRAAAYRITPGQVAGMATLATYGALSAATAKAIN